MASIIEIRNLGKKYRIDTPRGYLSLRDNITRQFGRLFSASTKQEEFWALKDLSFEIEAGERIGIIGRNGSGKSTLLKIISRITPPTTGKIIIEGRVASLLEIGTGFHPELTGRENIFFNGSILGMRRKEIEKQLEAIIDFSGVEGFVDTPLKHYSSGMQMRLAFSVAAHLESDILLVDEVLAVGDMQFQKKCIGKMQEVNMKLGKTLLFVSHNLQQLKAVCNTGILLHEGELISKGSIDAAAAHYTANMFNDFAALWQAKKDVTSPHYIKRIRLVDYGGNLVENTVEAAQLLYIEITIATTTQIENSLLAVRFTNIEAIPVYTTTTADEKKQFPLISPGVHTYRVQVPVQLFVPGRYSLIISWNIPNFKELDAVKDVLFFEIENPDYPGHTLKDGRLGVLNFPAHWQYL